MATEVFVFLAGKSKTRRHSGLSCLGVAEVRSCTGCLLLRCLFQAQQIEVLSHPFRLPWQMSLPVSHPIPDLQVSFKLISQHTHLPYHLLHLNDVISIVPGFAQFLVSLSLPVDPNKTKPMGVSVFLVRSSAGITCFSGVILVC